MTNNPDLLDTGGIEWDCAERRGSITLDDDPPLARVWPPIASARTLRWNAQSRRDLAAQYRASGNALAAYRWTAAQAMREFALAAGLDVEAREFERQAEEKERT